MPATYHRTIRIMFLGTLILTTLLVGYFCSFSLIAFQKAAVITPVAVLPVDKSTWRLASSELQVPDIRKLLGAIPYRDGKAIPDILPKERYQKTIEQGYGNCSNLTFGMAVYLLRNGFEFSLVHILPHDSFLAGNGHTLLNMPYLLDGMENHGLVDVSEGGLPKVNDAFIDVSMLREKNLLGFSILSLNPLKDDTSIFYGDFLNNATIGVVPREEVARYFSFVEQVYVSLGNKKLERVIFSGISVVLGVFPHTYVLHDDYPRLFHGNLGVLYAAKTLLWLLRLMPAIFLLFLISILTTRQKSQKGAGGVPSIKCPSL